MLTTIYLALVEADLVDHQDTRRGAKEEQPTVGRSTAT